MAMMNYCCVADFSTASPRDSLVVPQQPPEEPKPRRSRSLRSRFRRPSHGAQPQEKPEMADVTINTPTGGSNYATLANREGPGDPTLHMTEKGHAADDPEWTPPATYIVTPRPELQHTRTRSNSVTSKAPSAHSLPGFKRFFSRRQQTPNPEPHSPDAETTLVGSMTTSPETTPAASPKRPPPPPRPSRPVPKFNIPPPPPIPQSELASAGAGPSRPPQHRGASGDNRPGVPLRAGSTVSLDRSASTSSSKPATRRVGFSGNHRQSRRITPAFDPRSSTYRFIHSTINFTDPQLPDMNFLDGVDLFQDHDHIYASDDEVEDVRGREPVDSSGAKPRKGHRRGRSLFSLKRSLSNNSKTSWFGFRSLDAKEWGKLTKKKPQRGEDTFVPAEATSDAEELPERSGAEHQVPEIAVTQPSLDSDTSPSPGSKTAPPIPQRPATRPRRSNSNASAVSVADLIAKKPPFAMRRPLHPSGSSASLLAAIASDPEPAEQPTRDTSHHEEEHFVGGFKPEPSQKMLIDLFEKLRKKQMESEGGATTTSPAHRSPRAQSPLATGPMSSDTFYTARSHMNTGMAISGMESPFFKGSVLLSQSPSQAMSLRSSGSGEGRPLYDSPVEEEFPADIHDHNAYQQSRQADTAAALAHAPAPAPAPARPQLSGPSISSRTPADDDEWSEEEEDDEEEEPIRATIAQHLMRQNMPPSSYNASASKIPIPNGSPRPPLPNLQAQRPPPPPPRPSLNGRSRSYPAPPPDAPPSAMPKMPMPQPQNYARPITPSSYAQQPSDPDTSDVPPVPSTQGRSPRSRSKDTSGSRRSKNRSRSRTGSIPVRSPTPPMPRGVGANASEDEPSSSDSRRAPSQSQASNNGYGYESSEMQVPRATNRRSTSNPSPELALAAALDTAAPVFSTANLSRLSRISSSSSEDLENIPSSNRRERRQIVSIDSRPGAALPEVPGVPGHVLVEMAGTFDPHQSNYRVSNIASSTVASPSRRAIDKSTSGSSLESRSDGLGLNGRSRDDLNKSMSDSSQSPPPEYRPRTPPTHFQDMYSTIKPGYHARPSGRTTPDLGFGDYRVPFARPPLPTRQLPTPEGRAVPAALDSKLGPRFSPAARNLSPAMMGRTPSPASTIRA
ncbi:hypothetical protein FRB96_002530 [Tulasnella sp. 330]|nr:hypothetical protein FRB96_002530 [Tulasnella sp. 330]